MFLNLGDVMLCIIIIWSWNNAQKFCCSTTLEYQNCWNSCIGTTRCLPRCSDRIVTTSPRYKPLAPNTTDTLYTSTEFQICEGSCLKAFTTFHDASSDSCLYLSVNYLQHLMILRAFFNCTIISTEDAVVLKAKLCKVRKLESFR